MQPTGTPIAPSESPRPVDVAFIDLDRLEGDPDTLDDAERERARRYVFEADRRRYVAAHVALRRHLGERVGAHPGSLRFVAEKYGKPALAGLPDPPAFSLSHSGAVGLIAVADGPVPVGADVEVVRPLEPSVAAAVFAPEELAALAALDAQPGTAEWLNAFFRLWTLKEAVVKALGTGLSLPLASFAVALDPVPRLLRPPTDMPWRVVELAAPEGCRAALAAPAPFTVRGIAHAGAATTMM